MKPLGCSHSVSLLHTLLPRCIVCSALFPQSPPLSPPNEYLFSSFFNISLRFSYSLEQLARGYQKGDCRKMTYGNYVAFTIVIMYLKLYSNIA